MTTIALRHRNGSQFDGRGLSTSETETSEDVQLHSDIGRGFAAAILIIIGIVGFTGNLASISVIKQNRYLMRQCGIFLINLSVVGIVISVVTLPTYVATILANGVVFSDTACFMAAYFNYAMFLALLGNCVVIALLRCLLLTASRKIATNRCKYITIACLWLMPFVLAILGVNFFGFNKNQLHCIFRDDSEEWFLFILLALPTLVSLSAICVCHILIYRKVRRSKKQLRLHRALRCYTGSHSYTPFMGPPRRRSLSCPSVRETVLQVAATSASNPAVNVDVSHSMTNLRIRLVAWSDSHEREMKLTVQLVVNFTLFCVLWTPLMILYGIEDYVSIPPSLWLAFSILGRTFTGVDWIIYSCWTEQQRRDFARTVRGWCRCCGKTSRVQPQATVERNLRRVRKLPSIPQAPREDEQGDSGAQELGSSHSDPHRE